MRVILNADDFGCSRDTLRATIECFERGYISSASIMPNMPFTNEAVEFAKHASGVSFGVHLIFSRDDLESPLSDPATLATLTDIEGRFYNSNQVRARPAPASFAPADRSRKLPISSTAVSFCPTSILTGICTSSGFFAPL